MSVFELRTYLVGGLAAAALILPACSGSSGSPPVAPAYGGASTMSKVHRNDQTRSINDFVSVQGTFCVPPSWGVPPGAQIVNGCVLYVPPVENFGGWGTLKNTSYCPVGILLAAVDYAGLANDYIISQGGTSLGTTLAGTVNEHALSDGTAEVIVNLTTKNALAWGGCDPTGSVYGFDFATATLLFGNQAPAVLTGATAALANSTMQLK